MKNLALRNYYWIIAIIGLSFFVACSSDDDTPEPEPEPACTFESDPTCFCSENPTDSKCVTEPEPEPECTFASDPDCFCADNAEDADCIALELERVCNDFDKSVMFIRWRNSENAGDFTWAEMESAGNNLFTISQPASRWYTPDGDVPNFGAQLLEFSNQPDYGGLNDGQPWQLYRNQRNSDNPAMDWRFPEPVDGQTGKTAYYISVSTRDAQGNETVLCPAPEDVTNQGGFRLDIFGADGASLVTRNSVITYTIDAVSGEVLLSIEEADPCENFDRTDFYIRWRNTPNAGDFSWEQMDPVDGQPGVFTISQPASNWVAEETTGPNFGAQILEFSNQPDYGGFNNGQPWPMYRNWQNAPDPAKDWTFPVPVDGITSKVAYYIQVNTSNAQGEQTIVCDRPADVDRANGFRLLLFNDGEQVIPDDATVTYIIDTSTKEVVVSFE